ncbi:MAG: hypothetical protein Fur0018_11300 [Anaerolineales bacterium]
MSLALIIHGHFYQPPREDPLSGEIAFEHGAAPYSNWNERIHAECYQPNAAAGNFAHISFNIGPTLAGWMSHHDPGTLQRIIADDHANLEKYGVGNAIAQAYNHTILPLAPYRDKITQVRWGIADFVHRFGHKPTGMWLPETAVDTETLMVLADHGIEFTILAPWQANVPLPDVTEPYEVSLPGWRRIAVFFYHGELSARISFDPHITLNADTFVRSELLPRFNHVKRSQGDPQVLLLASDGELYGHHKPDREQFLAYLWEHSIPENGIEMTFPARWLREHPPRCTIPLRYNTSWSCHHGIARWETGCSCTPGDTDWKGAMHSAFNDLAAEIDTAYYNYLVRLIPDPWELRHRYIEVILGERSTEALLHDLGAPLLPYRELQRVEWMLTAQYERQRMFTSCGWFFDDYDRIEPKNNTAYAAQAVWMLYQAIGLDLSEGALQKLRHVVSQRGNTRGDLVFLQHLVRAQTSVFEAPHRMW